MRLALAQIDTRVADLPGNLRRIVAAAREAARQGADVVAFPELAVPGYPPRDLLCDPAFVERVERALPELAGALPAGLTAIVGTVARAGGVTPCHPGLHDVAAVLRDGRVLATRAKRLLPAYDVFHEARWFVPGPAAPPVELGDRAVGLLVCEDLWDEGYPVHPAAELAQRGASALICLSASPYRAGVLPRRRELARRPGLPLAYVNAVGAQDELVFDGASFVVDAAGEVLLSLPRFDEAVETVDLTAPGAPRLAPELTADEELFRALVLGVRDFAAKNGLRRAFLGLSGGIDSALVAAIAREALGPEAVTAIAMPSRHSDPRSTSCARELASALGVGFEVAPIEPLHEASRVLLGALVDEAAGGAAAGLADENVQARLRAVILMAHVNRHGGILLNTSNKTELSLGYGTLYGDMAGTLSVIGDLVKPQVYALARWYDGGRGVIPAFVLERPPSAELKADQVDPFDYPVVSPLAESLVQGTPLPVGAEPAEVARLARMLRQSEHKRWQAGIVLKVSEKAFGTGRMIPVTRG